MYHKHYLSENDFFQNSADHCVYSKQTGKERVTVIIWVDDLIIAASDNDLLNNVKKMLTSRFKMKDLGKLKHSWELISIKMKEL